MLEGNVYGVIHAGDAARTYAGTWRNNMKKLISFAVLAVASLTAYAHSGGTDRNGCHRDHSTGGWHCH